MIKNNYFTCFIFFCRFTLLVCGEKNILANLTNSQEPEPVVFGSLEPDPEPLEKKTRSRSRLGKKSGAGAGAAWKKSQEPEPQKNLPAPQPWTRHTCIHTYIQDTDFLSEKMYNTISISWSLHKVLLLKICMCSCVKYLHILLIWVVK